MLIDPPNLKQYFNLIEQGERKLPDLLTNILIRRTRNHILRWYGYDEQTHEKVDPSRFNEYLSGKRRAYVLVAGQHQFFPRRQLETIEYSIEETYQGLYQQLREYMGKPGNPAAKGKPKPGELTFARYGLWHYVNKNKQKQEPYSNLHRAGANLRGLIRILLFKRFESSVYAFKQTMRRLLKVHESFLAALDQGFVPAGEEAQKELYEADYDEETEFLDALKEVSGRYKAEDFDTERLRSHLEHDIALFQEILSLVEPITPEKDAKLQVLKNWLSKIPLKDGKRLIFTQYAETARYLYDNLNPAGKQPDIEVVFSGDKSKVRIAGRFAPHSNPEYQFQATDVELNTLIATDVFSEGLNLQDCDKIINYDLHWNPVRLIQRFGRIDRIGSTYSRIYGFNFLPETGLERNLGLKEKLSRRIQEIHDTIGEDAAILDRSEQLNTEAMYAIYEKKSGQLSMFEEEEEQGNLDLNEAEEILRQLKNENQAEYERIANMRNGLRTARFSGTKGTFVFCQADRYQQLFLLDQNGEIISRDIARILGILKAGPEQGSVFLPKNHNSAVVKIQRLFTEEVKRRHVEKEHTQSLSRGQTYILRELRALFAETDDEDYKAQLNILDRAFRSPLTVALNREINVLRRNSLTGQNLFKKLSLLYHQHNLKERLDTRHKDAVEEPVPIVVCSEALV